MGKAYDKQYQFAGGSCQVGTMMCCACGEPIDSKKQDWMHSKKTQKDGDWAFQCHHRLCRQDQAPWLRLEAKSKKLVDAVDGLAMILEKEMSKHGEDVFYSALEKIGIEFD